MKDYDAIAREIYRDEAISRMMYYDQQEDQCVELIAAILRKHDEAEAGGELLSDIIETSRMVQHDFNGRTGLFCHQSVDGIFETYSAPTDEKALREAAQAVVVYFNKYGRPAWGAKELQALEVALLAREAPKDESQKWVEHVVCEGAREHVLYWDSHGEHCSKPNCIINKPKDESKEGGS